jgi:hypothetical protein
MLVDSWVGCCLLLAIHTGRVHFRPVIVGLSAVVVLPACWLPLVAHLPGFGTFTYETVAIQALVDRIKLVYLGKDFIRNNF